MGFKQSLQLAFFFLPFLSAVAGAPETFSQGLATVGGDLQEKIYGACVDEVRLKLDTQCMPTGTEKSLGEVLRSQTEWQKVIAHLKDQDTQPLVNQFYDDAKKEQRDLISCEMSQLRSLLGVRTLPDGSHILDDGLKITGDIFIQGFMKDLCPKLPLMKKTYDEMQVLKEDLDTAIAATKLPSIYASHTLFLEGKSYSTSEGIIAGQKRVRETAYKRSKEFNEKLSKKVAEFNAFMASIWKASNPKMEEYIRQQMEEKNPSSCVGADPQKGAYIRDQFRENVIGGVGGGIADLGLDFGNRPGMIYQTSMDLSGIDELNQRGRGVLFERSEAGRLLRKKAAEGDPRAMLAACRIQKESDGVKSIESGLSKATWVIGGFGFFLRAAKLTAMAANMSSELLAASRVFLIGAAGLGVADSAVQIQQSCFAGSPTTIYNKKDKTCAEGAYNWAQETETLEKENCALSLVLGGVAVAGGYGEARKLLLELAERKLASKALTQEIVVEAPVKTPAKNLVVKREAPLISKRFDERDLMYGKNSMLFETKLNNGKTQIRYRRLEVNPATGKSVEVTYDVPKNAATGTIDAKTEIGRAVLDDMIKEAGGNSTLVFWDANHLGLVNYMKGGTGTGDKYLGLVVDSIRSKLRDTDVIFSNGGDEFVGIIRSTNPEEIKLITQRTSDAVAANPEIRKIFRDEVVDLSQSYKDLNKAQSLKDIPADLQKTLTPKQLEDAQTDFKSFKEALLEQRLASLKRQSNFKGSISLGSTPIQAGEDLSTVLQRAEVTAAKMKTNYKGAMGLDTSKYGQGQANVSLNRRGAPTIVTDETPLPKTKKTKLPEEFIPSKQETPALIMNPKILLKTDEAKLVEVTLPNGKTQLQYIRMEANIETGKILPVSYDVPRNTVSGAIDSKSEIGRAVLQDMLRSQEAKGSAVFIDLNHLGKVNYMKGGTVTGDQYIALESQAIRSHLRPGDLLFHNGGDEQVIILNSKDPREIKEITQRISDSVSEDPGIREIFRNEVVALKQQYQTMNNTTSYDGLSTALRESLSESDKALAKSDFGAFKRLWLDQKKTQMQDQAMYKGSISIGASLIRSGDTVEGVLSRAESAAAQMKSTYKARYGFDASKYGVEQTDILIKKRGAPIVVDPVP